MALAPKKARNPRPPNPPVVADGDPVRGGPPLRVDLSLPLNRQQLEAWMEQAREYDLTVAEQSVLAQLETATANPNWAPTIAQWNRLTAWAEGYSA